jgi:DegV family protein with EDD domain
MIHLVTDSSAYLPPEVKAQYNVHTVSLKICIGEQTYDEEGGITREAFFDLLANVDTTPMTSQPSAGEFVHLYQELLRDPDDEVISVLISSGLSGTVASAQAAIQQIDTTRVTVIDSRTAAIGLLIMVISAGEAISAGQDRAQVSALLERMVDDSAAFFMVENLAYLHKGGRINTASRFLGTLLNIKPILYMHNGKIEALDKTRTSKRARDRVLDEVAQRMGERAVRASVAHIQAPEAAEEMVTRVRARLNCRSLHMSEVGPAIGSHVGPGFLGVAACPIGEDGF